MTSTRPGEPVPDGSAPPARPRTIEWAWWATIAWAALTVVSAVSLVTARPYLRRALSDANAKSKTPIADYTLDKIDHDITRTYLVGGSIQAVLLAVILVFLGVSILRGRGWARWMLLAFATFIPLVIPIGIGIVLQLLLGLISDAPVLYRVLRIAAGLASVTVVVLLLMPESGRYFARLRPAGGRRGLFARPPARPSPRRPADESPRTVAMAGDAGTNGPGPTPAGTGPPARRAVATRPGSVRPKGAGVRGGRAKSRQDAADQADHHESG